MADPFRTLAVFQLSVQPNAPLTCKILLLELELGGQIEKSHLAFLLGKHIIEKRKVIAEKQHSRRIVHRSIAPHELIEENRRHGRDILVTEAQVGPGEACIVRLHCLHTNFPARGNHVPREDFLRQCHRPWFCLDCR